MKLSLFFMVLCLGKAMASLPMDDLSQGHSEHGQIKSGTLTSLPGRQSGQKGVTLDQSELGWILPPVDRETPLAVEFWVQPLDWKGISEEGAVLARIRSDGETVLELAKAEGAENLRLSIEGIPSMPIPHWGHVNWIKSGQPSSARWHQIVLEIGRKEIALVVDGWLVGRTAWSLQGDNLELLLGDGQRSTAFTDLLIRSGKLPEGEELRRQFKISYNQEPDILPTTVTVPYYDKIPGSPDELKVWIRENGTRLPAFTGITEQALLSENLAGYVAYDERAFYLLLDTPYQGELDARSWNHHDAPLWLEEAFEIYLHPPLTGMPDYAVLIGNPYGARSDLRIYDRSWNGRWDWHAYQQDNQWGGVLVAPFAGVQLPPPGDSATWTMNIFNTKANAAWSWTAGAYHNTDVFGILRFERGSPVIQIAAPQLKESELTFPVRLRADANRGTRLKVVASAYSPESVQPVVAEEREVELTAGQSEEFALRLKLTGSEDRITATVFEGEEILYSQNFKWPPMQPQVRFKPVVSESIVSSEKKGSEERKSDRYRTEWSAEELGLAVQEAALWKDNRIGYSTEVPAPWIPVTMDDEVVSLWNRQYAFKEGLLPSQITTGGEELLAGPIRLILNENGKERIFTVAEPPEFYSADETATSIVTKATSGVVTAIARTHIEFDGLAKVELELEGDGKETYDGLYLEIPIQADFARKFHYTSSTSGHPPATDSGEILPEGFTLDRLRELVWIGNLRGGLCWFVEGMMNWPLWDEEGLISLSPEKEGVRTLRIKLGDRPFRLTAPLRLVFGLQATPMRPRSEDFRKRADRHLSHHLIWYRGDGHYNPWHVDPEPARKEIEEARKKGIEIMPVSSLRFYGKYFFDRSNFYELPDPGLVRPEVYLWGDLWDMTRHPRSGSLPQYEETQVAKGNWQGRRFAPIELIDFSPASSFQDFYIWKLKDVVEKTGLGAIYLDQPLIRSTNPAHGAGYVDYKGEWVPTAPVFAMRDMIRRIYQVLYDEHGEALIRWHCSNQLIIPCLAFADINWDGENYYYGPLKVGEFYSKKLPLPRMQVQHTGLPFGFASDLLPEFGRDYDVRQNAPSTASVRDMMGFLMVHDSNVTPNWTAHNDLVKEIQHRRLDFPFEGTRTIHYWDEDKGISVEDNEVLYIAHIGKDEALFVLFNYSDQPKNVTFELDALKLGFSPETRLSGFSVEDFYYRTEIAEKASRFNIDVAPRDFRMLRLSPSGSQ